MRYISTMLQQLLNLSGILAILIAWLFVVFPALKYGINPTKQTITSATSLSKVVKRYITFGLIVGSFFQGLFIFYIIEKFQIPLFSIGNILYLTTNIATIFVALYNFDKHPKFHTFFALYYFIMCPISLILISLSVIQSYYYIFIFSLAIVLMYTIGESLIYKKFKGCAYLEIWAFFMLSIWTIVMIIV